MSEDYKVVEEYIEKQKNELHKKIREVKYDTAITSQKLPIMYALRFAGFLTLLDTISYILDNEKLIGKKND